MMAILYSVDLALVTQSFRANKLKPKKEKFGQGKVRKVVACSIVAGVMLDPLLRHEVEVGLFKAKHRLRLEVPVMAGRSMIVVRAVIVMVHVAAVHVAAVHVAVVVVAEIGSIRSSIVAARMVRIVAVEHRIVLV